VESDGWLLADPRWPDNILVATDGHGARVSRGSVEMNLERIDDYRRLYPHLTWRGCYHLHPDGDPIPSVTDRKAWRTGREQVGDYYVGIIATPRRVPNGDPELHGWLTTADFCEPLRLKL
jgi:proteasome lid subunit RPN8/RPN11